MMRYGVFAFLSFIVMIAGIYQLGRLVGRSVGRGAVDLSGDMTLLVSGLVFVVIGIVGQRLFRGKPSA